MALARCLSINFSSISSNCFSALSGLLGGCFNFGGCFKSSGVGKKQKFESKSPNWDRVSADDNSITSLIPTLPATGSFVMPIQDPENQNPEPIKINSVSVDLPQGACTPTNSENLRA